MKITPIDDFDLLSGEEETRFGTRDGTQRPDIPELPPPHRSLRNNNWDIYDYDWDQSWVPRGRLFFRGAQIQHVFIPAGEIAGQFVCDHGYFLLFSFPRTRPLFFSSRQDSAFFATYLFLNDFAGFDRQIRWFPIARLLKPDERSVSNLEIVDDHTVTFFSNPNRFRWHVRILDRPRRRMQVMSLRHGMPLIVPTYYRLARERRHWFDSLIHLYMRTEK